MSLYHFIVGKLLKIPLKLVVKREFQENLILLSENQIEIKAGRKAICKPLKRFLFGLVTKSLVAMTMLLRNIRSEPEAKKSFLISFVSRHMDDGKKIPLENPIFHKTFRAKWFLIQAAGFRTLFPTDSRQYSSRWFFLWTFHIFTCNMFHVWKMYEIQWRKGLGRNEFTNFCALIFLPRNFRFFFSKYYSMEIFILHEKKEKTWRTLCLAMPWDKVNEVFLGG